MYSGKAIAAFLKDLKENAEQWSGRDVLFLHTGGLLVRWLTGVQGAAGWLRWPGSSLAALHWQLLRLYLLLLHLHTIGFGWCCGSFFCN